MEEVIVRFKDGQAQITTKGFAGKACALATADLEKALGKKTADRPTEEMHKPVTTNAQVKS